MARFVFVALALVLVAIAMPTEGANLLVGNGPALTLEQAQQILIGNRNGQTTNCAKIGEYCTASDQCCSKRCLFYAAKCVT